MKPNQMTRREFTKATLLAGAAVASRQVLAAEAPKKIRTAVIGCGSVSGQYLPVLTKCPYVEVVSVCDIKPQRAQKRAEQFNIPHWYPHIDQLLAGAPFDFMITLTDMQEHEHLNRQALQAGK